MTSSGPRILRGAVFIALSPHGPSCGRSDHPVSRDAAAHAFATCDHGSERRKSEKSSGSEPQNRRTDPTVRDGLRYQLAHLGPQALISRAAVYAAAIAAVECEHDAQRSYREGGEHTRRDNDRAAQGRATSGRTTWHKTASRFGFALALWQPSLADPLDDPLVFPPERRVV